MKRRNLIISVFSFAFIIFQPLYAYSQNENTGAIAISGVATSNAVTAQPITTSGGFVATVPPAQTVAVTPTGGTASTPVPEPMTLILFGAGIAGIALIGRKRFKRDKVS